MRCTARALLGDGFKGLVKLGIEWCHAKGFGKNVAILPGYTFGLGFMVRTGAGTAGVPGSPGEFTWGGAGVLSSGSIPRKS